MAVRWSYFDRYNNITEEYLPASGDGDTVATQIVTAVTKLIYKWYNDGDVFDNTFRLEGWCNDLSSYANWLHKNTHADYILDDIAECVDGSDYEDLLKDLAYALFNKKYLKACNKQKKDGSIYKCDGEFKFEDHDEWDEWDEWDEDEE